MKTRLKIRLERDLARDRKTGNLLWHKSWNIPTIKVSFTVSKRTPTDFDHLSLTHRLSLFCVQVDDIDSPRILPLRVPSDLKVKVMAVKFLPPSQKKNGEGNLDYANQPVFQEVGLLGRTETPLKEGKCLFNSLKFKNTSFNHNGNMFHLVVIVY